MPHILELTKLIYKYRMPQVEIGRCRVKAGLDSKREPSLQFRDQLSLYKHLISAPLDHRQLLLNRLHLRPRTEY